MAITILKCQIDEDFDRRCSFKDGFGKHVLRWRVLIREDDASGADVLLACLNPSNLPPNSDNVPTYGTPYQFGDATDNTCFATDYDCWLDDPKNPRIWILEVGYTSVQGGSGNSKLEKEKKTKPNPLDWDTIYQIEWVEDQVPIEQATLLEVGRFLLNPPSETEDEIIGDKGWDVYRNSFPWMKRGSGGNEPGPIVNTANQQTIDPVTKPSFHPILVLTKNFPSLDTSIQLNNVYGDTTNNSTFLGGPTRCWRFITATTEPTQEKYVEGVGSVIYYPTTVKIEFNKDTWDLFILNNGQTCHRTPPLVPNDPGNEALPRNEFSQILDPRDPNGQTPMLFPATVGEMKEEVLDRFTNSEIGDEGIQAEDIKEVISPEPVNLTPTGHPVHHIYTPDNPEYRQAFHVRYRHYKEVDYSTILTIMNVI